MPAACSVVPRQCHLPCPSIQEGMTLLPTPTRAGDSTSFTPGQQRDPRDSIPLTPLSLCRRAGSLVIDKLVGGFSNCPHPVGPVPWAGLGWGLSTKSLERGSLPWPSTSPHQCFCFLALQMGRQSPEGQPGSTLPFSPLHALCLLTAFYGASALGLFYLGKGNEGIRTPC